MHSSTSVRILDSFVSIRMRDLMLNGGTLCLMAQPIMASMAIFKFFSNDFDLKKHKELWQHLKCLSLVMQRD